MRFWDSSALVTLLVAQPNTPRAQELYEEDDDIIMWWGTPTECDSSLARLERDELLTPNAAARAFERLDALTKTYHHVLPSAYIRRVARRLLRSHQLRAADALQLAAARVASEEEPHTLPFVCFDSRLAVSAQKEGFEVVVA